MFNDYINNDKEWNLFLNEKLENNYELKYEKDILKDFIENKKYKEITTKLENNNYTFSLPIKKEINKKHTGKKRITYTFKKEEMIILKFITNKLYKYDYLFEDNLYSFRKHTGVKNALNKLMKTKSLKNMYAYKLDISNYFNSINTKLLLKNLEKDLNDKNLFNIIKQILTQDKVLDKSKEIIEQKGIMAGTPTASFLANYYIKDIDTYFKNEGIIYLRYSDDIIIFTKTKEEQTKYSNILKELLKSYNLSINNEKEEYYNPHDKWEFLGFSFQDGKIDISNNSKNKIKGKIKRSAKKIRRWMLNKNVDEDKAIKVMIRKFNKKFYSASNIELSWKYWFFPIINTTKSLKEIDNYLQEHIRYIKTGKWNKKNYKKTPYSKLKELGYKSLVHEYYLFINMKSNMSSIKS